MKFFIHLLLFLFPFFLFGQVESDWTKQLKSKLSSTKSDTEKLSLFHDISYSYLWTNADSANYYAQIQINESKRLKLKTSEARGLSDLANSLATNGNYTAAIKLTLEALRIGERIRNDELIARCYSTLGNTYQELKNYTEAINCNYKSKQLNEKINNQVRLTHDLINLGSCYFELNKLDSSLKYTQEAYNHCISIGQWKYDMQGAILLVFGKIQKKLNNTDIANAYFRKAENSAMFFKDWVDLHEAYFSIASIYYENKFFDSSIIYFKKSLDASIQLNYKFGILNTAASLANIYRNRNTDSTLKYLELKVAVKDSIYNEEKIKNIQNIVYNEKQYQLEKEKINNENKIERKKNLQLLAITIFIISIFTFLILISKINANPKLIQYSGIISLLLLFEFISLLLHPFIEKLCEHEPFKMLIILCIIAATLAPIHKIIENWMHKKSGNIKIKKQSKNKAKGKQK